MGVFNRALLDYKLRGIIPKVDEGATVLIEKTRNPRKTPTPFSAFWKKGYAAAAIRKDREVREKEERDRGRG